MAKITRIAPELPAVNPQAALEYYEHKLGFRVAMQSSRATEGRGVYETGCSCLASRMLGFHGLPTPDR